MQPATSPDLGFLYLKKNYLMKFLINLSCHPPNFVRTFTQVSGQWQDTDSMREELDDLQVRNC
jgi:hypothetical protein